MIRIWNKSEEAEGLTKKDCGTSKELDRVVALESNVKYRGLSWFETGMYHDPA